MLEITSYEQFQEVIGGTALVKLGAVWCAPCKTLDATLKDVAFETGFPVYKVDVDKLPEVAAELKVMSVPATFVYKEGKLANGFIGAKGKDEIINTHLAIGGKF